MYMKTHRLEKTLPYTDLGAKMCWCVGGGVEVSLLQAKYHGPGLSRTIYYIQANGTGRVNHTDSIQGPGIRGEVSLLQAKCHGPGCL